MLNNTVLMSRPTKVLRPSEPLLREALGAALRGYRNDQHVTLRELAQLSRVSPGYLSELERGRKEVSSELLASVCQALGVTVADVLIQAASTMSVHKEAERITAAAAAARKSEQQPAMAIK